MKISDRLIAAIAYLLPVLGWLYIWIFERKNRFAMFHLRQSVGIFLIVLMTFAAWVVVGWVLTWIPYMFVFSIMLYGLVIVVVIVAVIAWVIGIINALRLRQEYIPIFGRWANRLLI